MTMCIISKLDKQQYKPAADSSTRKADCTYDKWFHIATSASFTRHSARQRGNIDASRLSVALLFVSSLVTLRLQVASCHRQGHLVVLDGAVLLSYLGKHHALTALCKLVALHLFIRKSEKFRVENFGDEVWG